LIAGGIGEAGTDPWYRPFSRFVQSRFATRSGALPAASGSQHPGAKPRKGDAGESRHRANLLQMHNPSKNKSDHRNAPIVKSWGIRRLASNLFKEFSLTTNPENAGANPKLILEKVRLYLYAVVITRRIDCRTYSGKKDSF
jgi:hypothetical protein